MIRELIKEYKAIPGKRFAYNSRDNTITYNPRELRTPRGVIALLHEIAHCKLEHFSYQYDHELIEMEEAAWAETRRDAQKYGIPVDESHISYCLSTYRDWADKRATCPACSATFGEQHSSVLFSCRECAAKWEVNRRKDRRVMRRLIKS